MGYRHLLKRLLLIAIMNTLASSASAGAGDYRRSADRTLEIVYVTDDVALEHYIRTDALGNKNHLFSLVSAKYAGPSEVPELTGDKIVMRWVSSISRISASRHLITGYGYDPKAKSRTPSWFIFDLRLGQCHFFEDELAFTKKAKQLSPSTTMEFVTPITLFERR